MIVLKEVSSKKDLGKFIKLPYKIHQDHKEWLPPLISDEWKVFDKNKNYSFEHCDTIMFLALRNDEIVGRIMGIINHAYNKGHNENNARFAFMECYDEQEVFDTLINGVADWAKSKKKDKLVGPLGFSDKDPQGFLIEGFDNHKAVMVTNCSFPFMKKHIERNAFTKKIDLVEYKATIPEQIPEFYVRIAERVKRHGFKLLEFKKSKHIRPFVKPSFDLLNEAYADIYGFAPLGEIEVKEFSERFLPLLNPNFIKLILDQNEEVVAFVVAMPDIFDGFKKANGKLLPFGFIHLLLAFKKATQLNLLLGGVKNNIRNSGLDALLAVGLFHSAKEAKLKTMDSHLIMEENVKMRAVMERLDSTIYRRYRIYEKSFN